MPLYVTINLIGLFMIRIVFLLAFTLLYKPLLAQTKFMIGVSINPNLSYITLKPQTYGDTYQSFNHLSPGFSLGAGLNFGIYLSDKFFLLTGVERTVIRNSYQVNEMDSVPPSVIYGVTYITPNTYLVSKSYITNFSIEIPVLGNYMLTDKNKKISLFLSGGVVTGVFTKTKNKIEQNNSPSYTIINKIPLSMQNSYIDAELGVGCKINLNSRYSLLVIPNQRFRFNSNGTSSITTIRTMVMYNF